MYSCLQCSQLSELVYFLSWELSMSFYIFQKTQSLLSWSCGFNLQPLKLVGRSGVFFLSHTALGFNYGFISTSACGLSSGICSWGGPGDLGFPLWGPGVEVVQLLGTQGFWQHQVLRGVGGQGSRKQSALQAGILERIGQYWFPYPSRVLNFLLP